MPRINHFDLYADNPQRAAKFYTEVFGWRVEKWDNPAMDYWMIMTGKQDEPGIDGGLSKRDKPGGDVDTNLTLNVDSAEAVIKKATAQGGKLTMPVGPIPTVGWFAKIADTEGNIFGLMQGDPNAK